MTVENKITAPAKRLTSLRLRDLPHRLRRVVSSGPYRPEIDGIRFIAIFFVISWHFVERVSRAIGTNLNSPKFSNALISHFSDGYTGALIFFSLSAFVLLTQFKKHNGCLRLKFLKDYFKRRLLRIEPPYILILISTYMIICLTGYTPKFTHDFAENTVPLTDSLFASIFTYITFSSTPSASFRSWMVFRNRSAVLCLGTHYFLCISHRPKSKDATCD